MRKSDNVNLKILLLSIQPKYAKKIFDGTKCVELRRIQPQISRGDVVVVYVSSPIKQIWGSFEVEKIIEKPIENLWQQVKNDAGISKEEFDVYYSGATTGVGIFLGRALNIETPINLVDIKKQWEGFHPPQSYRYLTYSQLEAINIQTK